MLTNAEVGVASNPASNSMNGLESVMVPEMDGSEVIPSVLVVPPGAVSFESAAAMFGPDPLGAVASVKE